MITLYLPFHHGINPEEVERDFRVYNLLNAYDDVHNLTSHTKGGGCGAFPNPLLPQMLRVLFYPAEGALHGLQPAPIETLAGLGVHL
ncbi:MAG: hypothetical protein ACP5N6_14295, partial [Anaerolineae bacterium]